MNCYKKTSVSIVTYNHIVYIEDCLRNLNKDLEIIVVDNGSTDGTPDYIEKFFPNVKLIRNPDNGGYGVGNNIGIRNSTREYVVILNPDTKLEPDCIDKLIKPLFTNQALVTIPKVLLYNGEQINTCGNVQHITGMAFTRGAGEKAESRNQSKLLNGLSGVCFAISKENYLKLGGFDEKIFLYMEDTEISWKINANNLKILYIPNAVLYHDYTFKLDPEKIFRVERGRYMILRKYLTKRELSLLAPSLIMTEVLTWGYALLNGPKGLLSKLKAMYDGCTVDVEKVECNRKELLKNMSVNIPELEFNYNRLFLTFLKLANFTYKRNREFIY
jgi:GT2 family glycosyltransferase